MPLVQLCLLFLLPGTLLVLVVRKDRLDLAQVLLYGFAFSTGLVILVSALLLWGGGFSLSLLIAITASLTIVLAIIALRQRRTEPGLLQHLFSAQSLRASLGPIVVAGVVVLLGLLTPQWNFLLGSNMDAGNYEIYGNHFLRTGSFFYESEALRLDGVPPSWIESGNTWNVIPGTAKAKPSFFPGFPVLLAVFKGVFQTPLASTWASLALAAASAGLLVRGAAYVMGNRWLSSMLILSAVMTPIFFFYSKQIMSEPLALLGTSLIVDVLVRHRSWLPNLPAMAGTAIGVGMFLALTAKLDALVLVALVPIGLALIALERSRERPLGVERLDPGLAPTAGVLLATSLVALLADPGYASKLVPGRVIEYVSPPLAILAFGLVFAGLVTSIRYLPRPRLETSRGKHYERAAGPDRGGPIAFFLLSAVWLVFVVWNLFFRPRLPFDVDHNAHNLLRLFDVVDPTLMALFLIASIVVLAIRGADRPVMIMLLIGLTVLIITSRHSRTELWWMRRYLYVLIPAISIGIAGGFRRLFDSVAQSRMGRVTMLTLFGAAFLGLIVIRGADMGPLFRLDYNPTTPQELEVLSASLRSGDVVVIPEGHSSIRALVSSKRSLDGQIMLGEVEPARIPHAIQLAQRLGSRVVLATETSKEELTIVEGGFQSIGSGTVTEPGVHYLAHVLNNPNRSTTVPFELFALSS